MRYTNTQRIQKILLISEQLKIYLKTNNISEEMIKNDLTLQWTVTTPLYNIGEHVYNISSDFKEKYSTIPWNRISGLRHRLVHDYEGTNWNIICQVLFQDLPSFIEQLTIVLKKEQLGNE